MPTAQKTFGLKSPQTPSYLKGKNEVKGMGRWKKKRKGGVKSVPHFWMRVTPLSSTTNPQYWNMPNAAPRWAPACWWRNAMILCHYDISWPVRVHEVHLINGKHCQDNRHGRWIRLGATIHHHRRIVVVNFVVPPKSCGYDTRYYALCTKHVVSSNQITSHHMYLHQTTKSHNEK